MTHRQFAVILCLLALLFGGSSSKTVLKDRTADHQTHIACSADGVGGLPPITAIEPVLAAKPLPESSQAAPELHFHCSFTVLKQEEAPTDGRCVIHVHGMGLATETCLRQQSVSLVSQRQRNIVFRRSVGAECNVFHLFP